MSDAEKFEQFKLVNGTLSSAIHRASSPSALKDFRSH